MRELNWIGAILGTSVLIVPWLGISKELFHFIYGFFYLSYSLIYAGHIITNALPIPGLHHIGINLSRGGVNAVMMTMVLSVMIYAAYGVQGWLIVLSTTG